MVKLKKIVVMMMLVFLVMITPGPLFLLYKHGISNFEKIIITVIFFILFSVYILISFYFWDRVSQSKFKLNLNKKYLIKIFVSLILILGIEILGGILNSGDLSQNQQNINSLLSNKWIIYVFSISSIIFSPILEELVFRGYFMDSGLINSPNLKVIVSGILFSVVHASDNFITFLMYTLIGIVLAFSYLKTKDIKVPIIIHMLNNIIALLL